MFAIKYWSQLITIEKKRNAQVHQCLFWFDSELSQRSFCIGPHWNLRLFCIFSNLSCIHLYNKSDSVCWYIYLFSPFRRREAKAGFKEEGTGARPEAGVTGAEVRRGEGGGVVVAHGWDTNARTLTHTRTYTHVHTHAHACSYLQAISYTL